ncbi:ABC transporter permease [Erysipelothrix sp. D19-032]
MEANISKRQIITTMVKRDLVIQARDKYEFVFRVGMLPFILILIYGYVLPKIGVVSADFPQYMFPGMVGMSLLLTGIHGTAVPLTMDFNNSREIEDRLQAPIDTRYIAIAKMIVGIIESWIGALIVLPISLIFMNEYLVFSFTFGQIIGLIGVLILASFASATLGLLVGTIVKPMQIARNVPGILNAYGIYRSNLLYMGCIVRITSIPMLVLVNPLVYINEALRAFMYVDVASMPLMFSVLGMVVFTIIMGYVGFKRFMRLAQN